MLPTENRIERLHPADYARCAEIRNLQNDPYSEQFRQQVEAGERITYIYRRDEAFVGEISMVYEMHDADYTIPGKRVYISRLIVAPAFRRQGIGSALVDFILAESRRQGFCEASIGVDKDNAAALALYQKKGFTTVLFDGEDADGAYRKLLKYL